MSGFWKVCSFICTQYLVGPPFALINASMREAWSSVNFVDENEDEKYEPFFCD